MHCLYVSSSFFRADWAKKLGHWKHEFVSTLKHYWLGFKLLWADVMIGSRAIKTCWWEEFVKKREAIAN